VRYGGEEFAAILPYVGQSEAIDLAANLHSAIGASNIENPVVPGGRLTISVGIACATTPLHGTREDLVEVADRALYRAKNAGRNRIEMAQYSPVGVAGVE
jgi:diguanylate cyclase (GGDEF)-like protein